MATNDPQFTEEHRKTFQSFTKLMAYCVVGVVIVLAGMAIFLL